MSKTKSKKEVDAGGGTPVNIVRQIQMIAIEKIDEDLPIRRFYSDESIFELASSLAASGVLQPILVRVMDSGRFGLVAGSRRLRAARKGRITELPAVVLEDIDERDALLLGLTENMQRENLTPFEEGWVILKLIKDHQMSHADIAHALKREVGFVTRRIQLMTMPEEIQEMIGRRELSLTHVTTLIRLPSAEEQVQAARTIAQHRLSPAEVRVTLLKNHPSRVQTPAQARPVKPSTPEKLVLRIGAFQSLLVGTNKRLEQFTGKPRKDLKEVLVQVRSTAHAMINKL